MKVVVGLIFLCVTSRLPRIMGCSGKGRHISTESMDDGNEGGEMPEGNGDDPGKGGRSDDENSPKPEKTPSNEDILKIMKTDKTKGYAQCKKLKKNDWPRVCYCTDDPKSKQCEEFCKTNAKEFADVCKGVGQTGGDIDAACKGDSLSACQDACSSARKTDGVCACAKYVDGEDCKMFCNENKKDYPEMCAGGEDSESTTSSGVNSSSRDATSMDRNTTESEPEMDPNVLENCKGEESDIDILKCKEACTANENKAPPCKCFATSAVEECDNFCKNFDSNFPVPCAVLEIDGACHGNETTKKTCEEECLKENNTAQVVEVCKCFSIEKDDSEACEAFCGKFKDYTPCELRGCSKPKALLEECDAACKALEQPPKEEVCQCTPKGRKGECMNKESGPCDGTKADNRTKETFHDFCNTIGDVHEVIENCKDVEKESNTSVETTWKYDSCETTCNKFNSKHPEDVKSVMECNCILWEQCDEVCEEENDEYKKLCEAEAKINETFADCIGENATYEECRDECEMESDYKAIICKCFRTFTHRQDEQCVEMACDMMRNKYATICSILDEFEPVDENCRGDEETANVEKCEEACNNLIHGKPDVCVFCTGETFNQSKAECKKFCAENHIEYSLLCNTKLENEKIDFKWTVKQMSFYLPLQNVKIDIRTESGEILKTNNTNKDGIAITTGLDITLQLTVNFTLASYEPNTNYKISAMKLEDQILLSPKLSDDKVFRTALMWTESPQDLDLHIIMYNSSGHAFCHGFYDHGRMPRKGERKSEKHNGCADNKIRLELDNYKNIPDQHDYMKPETLHVDYMADSVTYLLYVHSSYIEKEKNPNSLAESKAVVTIAAKNENARRNLKVPTDDPFKDKPFLEKARYWYIGCVDGKEGINSFKLLNKLTRFDPIINMEWLYVRDPYQEYYNDPAKICEKLNVTQEHPYPDCGKEIKINHTDYYPCRDYYLEKARPYQDICGETFVYDSYTTISL